MESLAGNTRDFSADARTIWRDLGFPEAADGAALYMSGLRVQQALLHQVEDALRPLSLSFARYSILFHLLLKDKEPTTLGNISTSMGVHPASITKAIGRLEIDRLAQRTPHPMSARTTLAHITPRGRTRCRKATLALNRLFEDPPLKGRDLDTYVRLSNRIRKQLGG